MNRTIRRALTVVGASVGTLALTTGTAFAHYCYRTDVPEGSKAANSQAWMTKAEALAAFGEFLPPDECGERVLAHMASLPENTLFMGPGLLAAGAVRKGQAPDGFGHVFEDARAFPECSYLFEDPHAH